jgi:hypothetical protein
LGFSCAGLASVETNVPEAYSIGGAYSPTVIYMARVEANGSQPWGRTISIAKPGRQGSPYFNEAGVMEMLASGRRTHLVYELTRVHNDEETVFVMHQTVDSGGSFTQGTEGRSLTPDGGFTPYLLELNGKPAVFYYDYKLIGEIYNHVVPIYRLLE